MHQSDQFAQLVRRVGYSVGLEEVVNRVRILTNVYHEQREMNLATWKFIVQELYGRKTSDELQEKTWVGARKSNIKLGAEDHFANFYSQLNLISKIGNQVIPLFGLENLSILRGIFSEGSEFDRALKILLTLYIFEADGDIFLNCILSDFGKEDCAEKISRMFEFKREKYLNAFTSSQAREKLNSVFAVQSAKANKDPGETADDVSKYLDKALQPRKGWYDQLEIDGIVGKVKLHSFLKDRNILIDNEFCAFFPYADTHRKLFISEETLGIKEVTRLEFTRDLILLATNSININMEMGRDEAIEILKEIHEAYKNTSASRGMIRHQVPLYVVYPCFYLVSILRRGKFIDLGDFLREETRRSEDRILNVTNLTGSEGALSIKQV